MAPILKQCCGCCDLRTGVILIAIFTIVSSGYTIVNEAILLNTRIPEMEQFVKDHSSELKDFASKYGISFDLINNLGTIAKLSCALAGVNILAAVFLLIPVCVSGSGRGRNVRGLIFVWVGWNIVEVLWSIGYVAWIASKYTSIMVAATLVSGLVISLLLTIYFLLVAVAYYQELGESGDPALLNVPPSNVPYTNMPTGNMPPPAYDYGEKYPDQYTKPV